MCLSAHFTVVVIVCSWLNIAQGGGVFIVKYLRMLKIDKNDGLMKSISDFRDLVSPTHSGV